jgi:hypothetical protein
MTLSRPIHWRHSHVDLIWLEGPCNIRKHSFIFILSFYKDFYVVTPESGAKGLGRAMEKSLMCCHKRRVARVLKNLTKVCYRSGPFR